MMHSQRAFTLVELSIVLVILGLLVGGVLTGQSLIRAAELRAITTEHDRYVTATQTFRDKYFALPGDMTNATAYWGKDNTNCSGNTGNAATPGTCNGNGDGVVTFPASAGQTGETFQFWKQLALAGMIEGTYTGIAGTGYVYHTKTGTNISKSRVGSAGWSVVYFPNYVGDAMVYALDYRNTFMFGVDMPNEYNYGKILKPEEAYNIDMKMDDGKPATGKVQAYNLDTCTTSADYHDFAGLYKLNDSSIACSLLFPSAF